MRWVIVKPPNIKKIVATKEGHCRLLFPMMAWPDVQPPAYLVPKPTIKPPITKKKRPLSVNRFSQLNISAGRRFLKSVMPRAARSAWVLSATTIASGSERNMPAIIAPTNIPRTKTRFHVSFFQSYSKKGIFAGAHAAFICLKEEDIPNDLFPRSKRAGTVNPIRGPAFFYKLFHIF